MAKIAGKGLAMDLELSLQLPQGTAVAFQTTVMAETSATGSTGIAEGVTLHLNVSAPNVRIRVAIEPACVVLDLSVSS